MHIAPTGFPWAFRRLPLSTSARGLPRIDRNGLQTLPARSDPDQFLNDVFNRVERRKAILGNDPVSRTVGLFEL